VNGDNSFTNAAAATLAVGPTGAYTLQGTLANSGAVTVAAGGQLTATPGGITNSAGGGITVAAGGTVTDTLNNSGSVDNAGAYNADADNQSFGVITNHSGSVWTGNLLSNAGAVSNRAGATWSGNAANGAGGTLGNSGIWNGTVSNAGIFTNNAGATVSGLLINSGTSNNAGLLSGGLTNTAGTTTNTGSIAGQVDVAGGRLTGDGTVANLTIGSAGMFAPGNGTAGSSTMVTGALAFASGALYLVQLNPSTASSANVAGPAKLGGATVNAIFANGHYVTKKYTIVTAAGGVSGSFNAAVSTNLPTNFHTVLDYDSTHAYLDLVLNFAIPPGIHGNQQNVGNALTNFFNATGSIPLAYGALTPVGLTQASGELATGSQQATFDAMKLFMGFLTDPFVAGRGDGMTSGAVAPTGYASAQTTGATRDVYAMFTKVPPVADTFTQRWSVWAAGYGGSQTTDGNAALGSNTATSSVAGTVVGADYRISPYTLAGFALAGGGTSFSVAGSGGGHSDLFQAGAFIRHTLGPAYVSAALAYGWQDITTDRTVSVAGVDQLRAEFNANAFSGRLEGGYRYLTPWLGITPYAAGQFTTFDLPSYAERVLSGAGTFALNYNAKDVTDTRSELGLRTDKSWAMQDAIFTLRGRIAWAHDFDPDRSIAATFQTLPGASFVVNGAAQASNSALTSASAEMKWINGVSLAATFEGEFSDVTRSYAGKGVVRYSW
jgi:uncharacterized protein with beta-barrel porin domain